MKLTQNHKDLINILKMLDVDSETIMALLPAVQEDEKAQIILEKILEMEDNKEKITVQKILQEIVKL